MPKACDIKRGMAVQLNGKLLLVKQVDVQSPSARGAATLYKFRFTDIATGQKVEDRFKGDALIESADLIKSPVSYSYQDGEDVIFMNNEDFSQYIFKQTDIEDELRFISDDTVGLMVMVVDGQPVGLEVPQTVELVIKETSPSIKGASASARTKPAQFETGLTIQVPEYISTGERIKINTGDSKFISRA